MDLLIMYQPATLPTTIDAFKYVLLLMQISCITRVQIIYDEFEA